MNKKLLKQIYNERRSNVWLLVELLLVSVVLWYVVDYIFVRVSTYNEPRGFDITNTYRLEYGILTEKSPDYIAGKTQQQMSADMVELADRLRRRAGVEAVSLSENAFPYNGNNSSDFMTLDTLRRRYAIRRLVTPDFFRVFRYRGANGESPEQLAQLLKEGTFMASNNMYTYRYNFQMKDLVGREFQFGEDSTSVYPLVAALQDVRYDDFQQASNSRSYVMLLPSNSFGNELCLRVRDGESANFAEELMKDAPKLYRVGNFFISKVVSFDSIRRTFQLDNSNEMRNYYVAMGFLLVNIFLGLLGTFWFRTQQRCAEMALMMAMGDTKPGIFLRLLSEGLLLLALVTPIALIIDYNIAGAELTHYWSFGFFSVGRFIICTVITFALMSLMILLGIWFPARQAMKIQPAEALHEE